MICFEGVLMLFGKKWRGHLPVRLCIPSVAAVGRLNKSQCRLLAFPVLFVFAEEPPKIEPTPHRFLVWLKFRNENGTSSPSYLGPVQYPYFVAGSCIWNYFLVGGLNPSEKYEFVSWGYDIPSIWNKIPRFQTTNQIEFEITSVPIVFHHSGLHNLRISRICSRWSQSNSSL